MKVLGTGLLLVFVINSVSCARLSVSGTTLTYNGEQVYLNGANMAWNNYGMDFGDGHYDGNLESWITDIACAGGNVVRMWVHVEGYYTPAFDINGYVTGCDTTGDFINDVTSFLDAAQANDVLAILTLWNGASLTNQNGINIFWDDSKMTSYLDNCLSVLASSVAGHPALGAWEAVNELEGSVKIATDSNACYDTTLIGQSGAGWTGQGIPMQRFLRSVGRMNQVIHANDPTGLTTLGSWGQFSESSAFSNCHNHYTDDCLNGATDEGSGAQLDFYQMHTYDWGGAWSPNAPMAVSASDYGLDKPLILGEYASICAASTSLKNLHEYAYDNGYCGGLSWHWVATGACSDTQQDQYAALSQLTGRTDHGSVDFSVN